MGQIGIDEKEIGGGCLCRGEENPECDFDHRCPVGRVRFVMAAYACFFLSWVRLRLTLGCWLVKAPEIRPKKAQSASPAQYDLAQLIVQT